MTIMIEYKNIHERESIIFAGEAKVLLDGGLRVFSSNSESERLRAALENEAIVLTAIALIADTAEGGSFTSVLRMEIESPGADPDEPPDSEHIQSYAFAEGTPTYIEFTYPPRQNSSDQDTPKTVIRYRPRYDQPTMIAPSGRVMSLSE